MSKKYRTKKKRRGFNHGLTLVNGVAFSVATGAGRLLEMPDGSLFEHFYADHFDAGVGYVEDLEFVVADDYPVLQMRDGFVLVDDIA